VAQKRKRLVLAEGIAVDVHDSPLIVILRKSGTIRLLRRGCVQLF